MLARRPMWRVLELRDGNFEFLDNFKGTITGTQRFFPFATVLAGKRVVRASRPL